MRYYCYECKETITRPVFEYSKNKYRKALCRNCQPKIPIKRTVYKESKKPTKESYRLYKALRERGVPVELEKWDGYKHIDIAIVEAQINIEVDGGHHNFSSKQALQDLKRTYHSFRKGFFTLRIPNSLIKNNLDATADLIVEMLNESNEQLDY